MKTILLLLFPLFISAQDYSTKTTAWLNTDTLMSFGFYFYQSDTDSTLEISGDTMQLIRYIIAEKIKSDSILLDYIDVVSASVGFANTVPDYYRKDDNPYWYRYWAHLKKLGYEITKRKNK